MPILRCPNCDEALDVVTRELGTTVQCDACDHEFRAKRSRRDEVEDEEDELPQRRRSSRANHREKEKKDNRTVFWIVGTVLVVLGLPCLGCLGFIIYTNTAKVGFTTPWVDQSLNAQDGKTIVMASFPANSVTQSFNDASGNGRGELIGYSHMDQAGSVSDAVTAIACIDYPNAMANPFDQVYLPLRRQMEELYVDTPISKGTISTETRLTHQQYPAKEARYSDDDGAYVVRVIHVNDRSMKTGTRLVVVVAGGMGLKPADRDRFPQSVRIGSIK